MKPQNKVAGVEFDDRDGAFQDTVEIKSQDAQPKEHCPKTITGTSKPTATAFTEDER